MELQTERECLVWLNKNGFFAWKNASTGVWNEQRGAYIKANPFQINGVSDIIAVLDGIVYFIEVKAPKGVQSPAQKAFEAQVTKHGGKYLLVRSLGELIEYFQG